MELPILSTVQAWLQRNRSSLALRWSVTMQWNVVPLGVQIRMRRSEIQIVHAMRFPKRQSADLYYTQVLLARLT